MVKLDEYVLDSLMRDLVGHDRRPARYLVYLWLAAEQQRQKKPVSISYIDLAESVGVSKSSAQNAVAWLIHSKLISATKANVTATPSYTVQTPWKVDYRRRGSNAAITRLVRLTIARCPRTPIRSLPVDAPATPVICNPKSVSGLTPASTSCKLPVQIKVGFGIPMLVLIVLLVSWAAFRAIGAGGVQALASWQDSARYALAVMFIFTATAHFNNMKHDLARMIPPYFPRPLLLVYITGVLELLGAAGLVLPQFRRLAGNCLIALLVGMFVANLNAAQKGVTLRGKPPTPL